MAQVTVTTEGIPENDKTFTVQWTATASLEMPTEIFVFEYSNREFSHVANAADLEYPLEPDNTKAFYRKAQASENFPSLPQANEAIANIDEAIKELVAQFNDGLSAFDSTTTTTYT